MGQTRLEQAKAGIVTGEMKRVAEAEGMEPERLRDLLAKSMVVIPKNSGRDFPQIKAIGRGLSTKVNANLGTSDECADLAFEGRKLEAAKKAGADSVMDLSTGGDLGEARAFFLENSPVMVGTVPVYSVATEMVRNGEALENLTEERLFDSIEAQCRGGVDYITVHCGLCEKSAEALEASGRIMPCVSRGGSIHLHWMRKNKKDNPLHEHFDDLLDIVRRHDVTLSLGDGFRPGATADAIDGPQLTELLVLARLADRARERGVQVMIEGPGHVPLEHIQSHVQLEKRLTKEAPFYVLGPLPTDIAAGYDHISGAIGGALAGAAGADFLCYVTPAEHLCLPDEHDVYQGVMASRIAAHVADLVKGVPGAAERNERISRARERLDWEAITAEALDPELVRMRSKIAEDREACTMCGKLCAVKLSRRHPD